MPIIEPFPDVPPKPKAKPEPSMIICTPGPDDREDVVCAHCGRAGGPGHGEIYVRGSQKQKARG